MVLLSSYHQSFAAMVEVDFIKRLCIVVERLDRYRVVRSALIQILNFPLGRCNGFAILGDVDFYVVRRTIPFGLVIARCELCRTDLHRIRQSEVPGMAVLCKRA